MPLAAGGSGPPLHYQDRLPAPTPTAQPPPVQITSALGFTVTYHPTYKAGRRMLLLFPLMQQGPSRLL